MDRVNVGGKSLEDYRIYLEKDAEIELDYYAGKMKSKKVAMVNSTAYGGGVAEILNSFVPLAQDMGLQVDWWVIKGTEEFYNVTKAFHNCLQGKEGTLDSISKDIYLRYNNLNAGEMSDWDYDFIIIHDPQPAALDHVEGEGDRSQERQEADQ